MGADAMQWIGWAATAMTVASYFCRNPRTLRMVQAVAAVVWMTYGVMIGAKPIIAANVLAKAGVVAWTRDLARAGTGAGG
ncbi:MAG: YgjV family protein [Gemmatimonadetes bacterium]|nr:YgjV family protein [Gemmatimonadota bacterium]